MYLYTIELNKKMKLNINYFKYDISTMTKSSSENSVNAYRKKYLDFNNKLFHYYPPVGI